MKVELVPEWKKAWKWVSVNCMVLAVAIQGGWASIDDAMRATVPHGVVAGLTIAVLVLGVLGRLIQQGKPTEKEDSEQ